MIVSYDVRAQIVLYLRFASTSTRSTHASQRSLHSSASEPTRRHEWGEAFPPTLARIANDHKSKDDSAYAMEAMGSTKLVKEDYNRKFPERAQMSIRLHSVF